MTEILIALISSGLIIFVLKECKDYRRRQKKHDLKIYRKFNFILNDKHIISIIKLTQEGYLPEDAYWRIDSSVEFIQLPNNQFLDKKLNQLLSDLIFNLHEIAQLYSMCGRCELVGNRYKLIAYKDGNSEEFDLINESTEKSRRLLKSYREFRGKVKRKFKL